MAGAILIAAAAALVGYTYLVYPALLRLLALGRPSPTPPSHPDPWPPITITVPVYNEVSQIRDTLESLLRIDYPADRRQILIVSDESSDGTDEVVREYANRGIQLLRVPGRVGKSAAENAARMHVTGDIVINTDASIRLRPDAVKALVRWFQNPEVGVATGRDVSLGGGPDDGNLGEATYVGYEMWVRDLETRVGGIVGASGSLYAIRNDLHQYDLPPALSRDFNSALVARDAGYRAVSVPEAVCMVPRTRSLRREFRRKVRTMLRGMQTLWYKRHLLDPRQHGLFAWKLFSHKLCRWAVPWAAAVGFVGLLLLDLPGSLDIALWTAVAATAAATAIAWHWPEARAMPRLLSLPAFAVAANLAAMTAVLASMRGDLKPVWEPTRRPGARGASGE